MLLINIILFVLAQQPVDLEQEAYECAMASEKTDGAICQCYTDRGLEAPL